MKGLTSLKCMLFTALFLISSTSVNCQDCGQINNGITACFDGQQTSTDEVETELYGFNFANFFRWALENYPGGNQCTDDQEPNYEAPTDQVNQYIRDAFLDLNPKVIRFPGGTVSGFYHYTDPADLTSPYDIIDGYGYTLHQITDDDDNHHSDGAWKQAEAIYTDDFCFSANALDIYIEMIDDYYGGIATKPNVIYVANILQHFDKDDGFIREDNQQTKFNRMFADTKLAIEALEDDDNDVIAVELGNEMYLKDAIYNQLTGGDFDIFNGMTWATFVSEYSLIVDDYINAFENAFSIPSDFKIGIPVENTMNSRNTDQDTWFDEFALQSSPDFQALIMHPYFFKPTNVGLWPTAAVYSKLIDFHFSSGTPESLPDCINVNSPCDDGYDDNAEYDFLIDEMNSVADLEIWSTEWNFNAGYGVHWHKFMNSQYVFRNINQMLSNVTSTEDEHISMSTFHIALEKPTDPRHGLMGADGESVTETGHITFFGEYYAHDLIKVLFENIDIYPEEGERPESGERVPFFNTEVFPTSLDVEVEGTNISSRYNFYAYHRKITDTHTWEDTDYGGNEYFFFSNSFSFPIYVDIANIYPLLYLETYAPRIEESDMYYYTPSTNGNESNLKYQLDGDDLVHDPLDGTYVENAEEEELEYVNNLDINSAIVIQPFSFGYIDLEYSLCGPYCSFDTCTSQIGSFTLSQDTVNQEESLVYTIDGQGFVAFLFDSVLNTGWIPMDIDTILTMGNDTFSTDTSGNLLINKYVNYPTGDHEICIISSRDSICADTICHALTVCSPYLIYDGTNDKTTISHSGDYYFDTVEFTIEAVIQNGSTTNDEVILFNYGTSSTTDYFALGLNNGKLYFKVYDSPSLNYTLTDTDGDDIQDGTCHHVAVSRSTEDTIRLYVDGVEVESGLLPSNVNLYKGATMIVGNSGVIFQTVDFEGGIDELRIWDYECSEEQLSFYYDKLLTGDEWGLVGYWPFNEGTGTTSSDLTSNNNDATLGARTAEPDWDDRCCNNTIGGGPERFSQSQNPSALDDYGVFPNPFADQLIITLSLNQKQMVELVLFNVNGVKVATILNSENRSAGNHTIQFDSRSLEPGVYFYQIKVGEEFITDKVILQR